VFLVTNDNVNVTKTVLHNFYAVVLSCCLSVSLLTVLGDQHDVYVLTIRGLRLWYVCVLAP